MPREGVTLRGCTIVNGSSNGDSHRRRPSRLFPARSCASNTDTLRTRQGRKFSRCTVLIVAPFRVFVFFISAQIRLNRDYMRRKPARRTLKRRAIKPYREIQRGDLHLRLMGAIFISRVRTGERAKGKQRKRNNRVVRIEPTYVRANRSYDSKYNM